jgi:hypothetical protein
VIKLDHLYINPKYAILQNIATICAFYLAVSSLFPQLRVLPQYQISIFFAMLIWLVLAMLIHPNFFIRPDMHTLFLLFFISYTFLVSYFFGNNVIGNRYFEHAHMFIFCLIYQYNFKYDYANSNKKIILWVIPFIIYTGIVTLMGLVKNPYLSRSIKSEGEYTLALRAQGIGGYEFVYFLVFISIILLFTIINAKSLKMRKTYKYLAILMCALFVAVVVYSNYFTAIIMLLLSFFIVTIFKSNNITIKFFSGFIIIIFFFNLNMFMYVTNWLIQILGSGRNVERLLELQNDFMGYEGLNSIFAGRSPTILISWTAFKENFLFGIITKPIESSGGYLSGFGQHSYLLDTFALFGVIIGLLNIYLIFQPLLIRLKREELSFSLILAVITSFIIITSINNVTPSIGFAVFFVLPFLYEAVKNNVVIKRKN